MRILRHLAIAFLAGCATSLYATDNSVRAHIPFSDLGAKVTADYKGEAIGITKTAGGARLHTAFQKLAGTVTREGLWLDSTANGGGSLHLVASAHGREGRISALPATGVVAVTDQLVTFTRPGLTEEYSVSADGVRQDFVVAERVKGTGALSVMLDVDGATAEAADYGVRLTLAGSKRVLAYSRLRVTDAIGHELAATMEVLAPGRIAVRVDDIQASYPIRIDPTFSDADWSALGSGINNNVNALMVDNAGNLYAGGFFTTAGGVPVNNIAKWNGSTWSALGTGVNSNVKALAVDNTGNLYAGGIFDVAGGVSATYIAKWDGSTWSSLGSGMSAEFGFGVNALAIDGAGNLYAAGAFSSAGGITAACIAKWDGHVWSALGTVESGVPGINNVVNALAMDGAGNLYAGGNFSTAGSVSASRVAKWDGSAWSALGSGITNVVSALAVDSTGNLYAGGGFAIAGGVATNRIAKWDGSAWSPLGSGTTLAGGQGVNALAVDGDGNLYVGGIFSTAGGVSAKNIAKWDGSAWSALDSVVTR